MAIGTNNENPSYNVIFWTIDYKYSSIRLIQTRCYDSKERQFWLKSHAFPENRDIAHT